ncbi:hypothetical protein CASFOL_008447 [Castilleja foliolosa]|uniref:Small heat shock protein n=1 Tax=Castilleja foliolosa TaxID=1961234 RepID=A0ABD3E2Z8_9LAMI
MANPLRRLLLSGLVGLSIPVALPSALRYFRTPAPSSDDDYDFYVDCGPAVKSAPAPKTPIPAHEFKARNAPDGFHLRLYMAGVGREDVKVWYEGDDLIAEGYKEKDFEDEDDILMRYRVTSPPDKLFDLDATRSDIDNGLLKVFVPRRREEDLTTD